MVDITTADKDTKELYNYLLEVANDIVKKYSEPLDKLVKQLSKDIDTCSNEQIRSYMGKISVEAYTLNISKEQSVLKEACASALYKEGVAKAFNSSTGTVEARKNQSVIDSMDKQAVSMLYSTVSSIFKAKVDEAHRLASTLNGILISRSADAKLQYSPRSEGDVLSQIDDDVATNSMNEEEQWKPF